MLEVRNITVSHAEKTVLEKTSFVAERGSFTAVLGKNGAGKSTLLEALASLLPYEGEALWDRKPLGMLSVRERAKTMAFLPQMLRTPPFTVRELVSCGRSPYLSFAHRMNAEDVSAVEKALALTDTVSFADRLVSTLSGGERQRAFLAMALAQNAPILLLDEPTSYMDIAAESAFLALLSSLSKKENKTVLAVMHDLSFALRYADRILILECGKTAFFGTKEECLASRAIENVFGVRRYSDGDIHFFTSP